MLAKKYPELSAALQQKNHSRILEQLKALPETEKGEAFEIFLCDLYRGNGFIVKLSGGRNDEGADLLVHHKDDPETVILIIQAKNRSRPISFSETLLELKKLEEYASKTHRCNYFEIVSTSGFVSDANRLQKYNLKLSDWNSIAALVGTYGANTNGSPTILLAPHNELTYSRITDLFKTSNRVTAIQATGTGKSYLIAKLISDNIGKRTLVLAPSTYILENLRAKFHWIFSGAEMMTYQKIHRSKAKHNRLLPYELIVLDEFHRAGAEKWGAAVKDLLEHNANAHVFGTSATPVRYLDSMRDMSEEIFEGERASEISLAEAVATKLLPEPKYITGLYTLQDEVDAIKTMALESKLSPQENEDLISDLKRIEYDWEKTSGIPLILKNHLPASNNKIIIFCKDRQHLDAMEPLVSSWFQKACPGRRRENFQILSQNRDNKTQLERFKRECDPRKLYLLFCIDMLNEGLHFNDVGAVILLRPTISPTIFFQQIGRCLEVNGKHQPVIFDLVNNFRTIRSNDFRLALDEAISRENSRRTEDGLKKSNVSIQLIDYTITFCKILNEIVDRLNKWAIMFSHLQSFKTEYGHCDVPNTYKKQSIQLGSWVARQRTWKRKGILAQEKVRLLDEIGLQWEPERERWDFRYQQLLDFMKKMGHSNIPKSYHEVPGLANWVATIRRNASKLSSYQITKLKDIDFVFDVHSDRWESYFNEYQMLNKNIEDANSRSVSSPNSEILRWASKQRFLYRKNKLSKHRLELLNSINFPWDIFDSAWANSFQQLSEFNKKYGHCNVPDTFFEQPTLANWVREQRRFKHKLSKDRIDLLDSIGFEWIASERAEIWNVMFSELKKFRDIHGHCNVPISHKEMPKLGRWVNTQRSLKKKGALENIRINTLNAIGFEWDIRATEWSMNFVELIEFKKRNGHCEVPRNWSENKKLGAWVDRQRRKKNELSKYCLDLLNSIGFNWN